MRRHQFAMALAYTVLAFALAVPVVGQETPVVGQDDDPSANSEPEAISLEEAIAALSDSFREAGNLVDERPNREVGAPKKLDKKIASTINLLNAASSDGLCISSITARFNVAVSKNRGEITANLTLPNSTLSGRLGGGATTAVSTIEVVCINPKCRADT